LVEKYSIETNLKRIRLILPDANEEEAKKLASDAEGFKQAVSQRVTGKVSKKWVYTYNDIMSKS
jgi:tryptophan synthase alpha subunit